VPDLLDHLRATYGPDSEVRFDERFEEVRDAPVLILDDLGTQNATPWAQEKLYQILNHRYNAQLPTVVTTNQDLADIDHACAHACCMSSSSSRSRLWRQTIVDGRGSGGNGSFSSLQFHRDQTFDSFSLRADELPPEESDNLKRALTLASTMPPSRATGCCSPVPTAAARHTWQRLSPIIAMTRATRCYSSLCPICSITSARRSTRPARQL